MSDASASMNTVSMIISLLLVVAVTAFSTQSGSKYVMWAYAIGDEPLGRMVFLILVGLISVYYSFQVALMLVVLYMLINSMVPVLADMDESFIGIANEAFGPTLTDCSAYSADEVKAVGTPFSPTFAADSVY